MNNPLVIKQNNGNIEIAQMYQEKFGAEECISKDFVGILDRIIIDIYLKENVFSSTKYLSLSDKEKEQFVLSKRKEILDKMMQEDFDLAEYLNSEETSFKMTSCVKCNILGIHDEAYNDWKKDNPSELYCECCKHEKDDFGKYCRNF